MGKKKNKPDYEVVGEANAEIIGVTDTRFPDAEYKFAIAEDGFKVSVVLTEHVTESQDEGRELICMVHDAIDKALAKFFKEG